MILYSQIQLDFLLRISMIGSEDLNNPFSLKISLTYSKPLLTQFSKYNVLLLNLKFVFVHSGCTSNDSVELLSSSFFNFFSHKL